MKEIQVHCVALHLGVGTDPFEGASGLMHWLLDVDREERSSQ
jgi:hypothetical protein